MNNFLDVISKHENINSESCNMKKLPIGKRNILKEKSPPLQINDNLEKIEIYYNNTNTDKVYHLL